MNDMDSIPAQLQAWKLRQPSDAIREQLFSRESATAPAPVRFALPMSDIMRWALPALGCFAMVLMTLSPRTSHYDFSQTSATNFAQPLAAVTESYRPFTTMRDPNIEMNSVPVTRMDISFGARPVVRTIVGGFKTNILQP